MISDNTKPELFLFLISGLVQTFMAKNFEELLVLKGTALRYLIARESRLLALGKRPINKKIANFVRTQEGNTAWTSFLDTLNEDLTRNIHIFEWKVSGGHKHCNMIKRVPVCESVINYKIPIR